MRAYLISQEMILLVIFSKIYFNIRSNFSFFGFNFFQKDGFLTGTSSTIMRDLFITILRLHIPIVVHNGFLDLMFIYRAFYASLPPKIEGFVADLAEMTAKGGLFDTKYIAEFVTREKASYLAYLYRK